MSDDLRHAPTCEHPGTTITHGHSVDVEKCDGCGCLSTTRRTPPTTTRKATNATS